MHMISRRKQFLAGSVINFSTQQVRLFDPLSHGCVMIVVVWHVNLSPKYTACPLLIYIFVTASYNFEMALHWFGAYYPITNKIIIY
jgi:hypothetical protein